MIDIRPFESLGAADHGWLDARHHFSFAGYHNPDRMGWGALRVWNDDAITPKGGFSAHPHRDMEIITYVRQGAMTHRDSLGNEGRTEAGDVQVISAGTGIEHSEFNLEDEQTRLFQIWIIPDKAGGEPRWDARPFPTGDRSGQLEVLASGMEGDSGALQIRADARVIGVKLGAGQSVSYAMNAGRHAYLVPATGQVSVDGQRLNARDGAAITGLDSFTIEAAEDAEIVLVDAA